jgi:ATP phosphoribosyltransferase regulatory subunit HisZ
MTSLVLILGIVGIATALLAAWLWYAAGRSRLRRISRFENLDAADLNRIVTTINRSSLLNSRAALAAAASAASLALRFAVDVLASF